MNNKLQDPCQILPGVGVILATKLAKCGIHTIQDLIFHLPLRYQDRTRVTCVSDLRVDDWCVVIGRICKTELRYGKRKTLHCYLEDKTGILKLRFFHFNQQQIKNLKEDATVCAFGEVRSSGNTLEMIHPEYQLVTREPYTADETLTPIYPSTQGLSQTRLRQWIQKALYIYKEDITQLEWMDAQQLKHHSFPSFFCALECLHYPPPETHIHTLEDGTHPALRRLAFDELLAQRLSMQWAKMQRMQLKAPSCQNAAAILNRFIDALPFPMTNAQQRVCNDIHADLSQARPMLRLVQGDVGSGKTVVAAYAAIQAIGCGFQVALMAPTEILSEQHTRVLNSWLSPLGIVVQKLNSNIKGHERKEALAKLENHTCHLIVGTHALFQESVHFARLGLVIIDEQHRFGVEQRLSLHNKGQVHPLVPHQLLLTATPIPRTLAMTQFAHLDISILDELPPGRTPITTSVIHQDKRSTIISRLKTAIEHGRQIYWVCTLIDDSEKLQCIAATSSAQNLQQQLLSARVGLIHGRMKQKEKEEVMAKFQQGQLDILVATTVVEVGVDVPNASLMIIENAERLGLSQLHQLRGRVGRGCVESHCILLYQPPLSPTSYERLQVMRATHDGFVIAEKDLHIRGAGEFLGTRQTGAMQFKVANLQRDYLLLHNVAKMADHIMAHDVQMMRMISQRWLGDFLSYLQS